MSVRPLIGCATTPFFNLAPVSAASSPPTPPPYILYPPSPISLYTAKIPDRQFFPTITTLCSFVVINNLAYWAVGDCSQDVVQQQVAYRQQTPARIEELSLPNPITIILDTLISLKTSDHLLTLSRPNNICTGVFLSQLFKKIVTINIANY